MRKLSPPLPLLALAWARSRGRVTWAVVALLTVVTTGLVAGLGMHLAKSAAVEARDALDEILLLHARAVVWGPGFVGVVGATLHARKRDRDDGIDLLVAASGYRLREWVLARTALLALALVGLWATSAAVLALVVLGTNPGVAHHGFLGGMLPASVFAVATSVLLAMLGSACLGPRSRPGGYLLLAFVLFVPEMLSVWTRPLVGRDLTSLPALIAGLAHAARPDSFDAARLLSCGCVLSLVLALLLVWTRVGLDEEGA